METKSNTLKFSLQKIDGHRFYELSSATFKSLSYTFRRSFVSLEEALLEVSLAVESLESSASLQYKIVVKMQNSLSSLKSYATIQKKMN